MTKQNRDEIRERMMLDEQTPEDVAEVFQVIDEMIYSLATIRRNIIGNRFIDPLLRDTMMVYIDAALESAGADEVLSEAAK